MKLFAWNDPYKVPYGKADLFVIAADLATAKEEALRAMVSRYGNEPHMQTTLFLTEEPSWTRDGPCAFVYEFEE